MQRGVIFAITFGAIGCTAPLDPDIPSQPSDNLGADPNCESWTDDEGQEFFIEGATRYLVVDFDLSDGDSLNGTLQYLLFANNEWKNYGEDDCQVQWMAAGSYSEEVGACAACSQRLDVNYTLDMQATNCPAAFYEGLEQASESYDILFREDAPDASIYWSGSGNLFTDNAWATKKRVWGYSDPACAWFGDSN